MLSTSAVKALITLRRLFKTGLGLYTTPGTQERKIIYSSNKYLLRIDLPGSWVSILPASFPKGQGLEPDRSGFDQGSPNM